MGMKLEVKIFGIVLRGFIRGVAIFIAIIAIVFCGALLSLGWNKFFEPKKENVRREVFEQTQSYVHGKVQDLAKYHDEYNKCDIEDREAIRQLIILRFAEFDESKITSANLRNFLTKTRGY